MRVLILLALLISTYAKGQIKQPPGAPLEFADIIYANDSTLSKDELYSRVLVWSGEFFKSSESVIDVQDRQSGTFILKAKMPATFTALAGMAETQYASYPVKISIKQGRVKVDVGVFICHSPDLDGRYISTSEETGYRGLGHKAIDRMWHAYRHSAIHIHESLVLSLMKSINTSENW